MQSLTGLRAARVPAGAVVLLAALALGLLGCDKAASEVSAVPFARVVIDADMAGDCKAAGDLDGDGLPDLVVGGMPAEGMNWYGNPAWQKSPVAVPTVEFTTDCALGDVDNDGDLDIVVPDGDRGDNLLWFENRLHDAGADQWPRRLIGSIGDWGKDVELADFDRDGRLDVGARGQRAAMLFVQEADGSWQRLVFDGLDLGDEGMASGDIDGDGSVDLVLRGNWLRNPGGELARSPQAWQSFGIGSAPATFKAVVADIDRDGTNDVVYSSSEGTADVVWWSPRTADPTGPWRPTRIARSVERAHTLQVADMDGDGDLDVVIGQMHTARDPALTIASNLDGEGGAWSLGSIDRVGSHDGIALDVDLDGDVDVFGANWTGNPPVHLWLNGSTSTATRLDRADWRFVPVTRDHARTFGLGFGDADADGDVDIASGPFLYLNPGGGLDGTWPRRELPETVAAFAVADVDGDDRIDILAQAATPPLGLLWLEAEDAALSTWRLRRVGDLPDASHEIGAQGYQVTQLLPGARPSVLLSSGGGIFAFEIPADPETAGRWPRTRIAASASDEGFAVADIDRDDLPDVVASTGESKLVEWYRNPGDGSADWQPGSIGSMNEAVYPDRVEAADLDGDGWSDVIVSEENGLEDDASTFWWRNPGDADAIWERRRLAVQATTNSLAVADFDRDGDVDIVTGEHRGPKRVTVWENDGSGGFRPHVVLRGRESHLGVRPADLDGDGDLDLVSIAWDSFGELWLLRLDLPGFARPPA